MFCTHRTRLAKSSAKLNLRSQVTAWDAIFAVHLYEESLLLRTGRLAVPVSAVFTGGCFVLAFSGLALVTSLGTSAHQRNC